MRGCVPALVARAPRAPQLLASFRASSPGGAEAARRGAALGSRGGSASCPQAGSHDPLHFLQLAERGGGSAAIRVEGEAKSWPQPGNGLHTVFPKAMTRGVGAAHSQELVCLLPSWPADATGEQVSGNLVSGDFSLMSRARLSPQKSCYMTF